MSTAPKTKGGRLLQLVQPPSIAGRLPPHDLDAEAAVLSAILLKHDASEVERFLQPEHFYSPANSSIYEAALAVAARGGKLDVVNVAAELRDREKLDAIGGTAYLAQILDSTPAISHVASHAAIVTRKARVRAAIATMQLAAAEGYNDHGDDDEWLRDLSARIEESAKSGAAQQATVTLFEAGEELDRELKRQRELQAIGVRPGLDVGDIALQRLTGGLHRTEVVMLSAPTKGFKTTRAMAMALSVARSTERVVLDGVERVHTCGVAICECEMTAPELAMLAASMVGGAPRERFRTGEATPEDYDRLAHGKRDFERLPITIDARTDIKIGTLRASIREQRAKLMAKFGAPLRLVIVDTLQLLGKRSCPDPSQEQAYMDLAAATIRELSLEPEFARVSWLVLSQLNENGQMRGSRAITHHCSAWWDLRVVDDDGPFAKDYLKIARITVRLQRAGKQGNDVVAASWINVETGRVDGSS